MAGDAATGQTPRRSALADEAGGARRSATVASWLARPAASFPARARPCIAGVPCIRDRESRAGAPRWCWRPGPCRCWGQAPPPLMLVCVVYASQAICSGCWAIRRKPDAPRRPRRRQWVRPSASTCWFLGAALDGQPGFELNFTALLALPVLMAGVMTKRLAALATAAFVALVLLAGVWHSATAGSDSVLAFSQAGLGGIGAFVITLIASELAGRLAREERAARGSLGDRAAAGTAQPPGAGGDGRRRDGVDRAPRARRQSAARGVLGIDPHRHPMPCSLQVEVAWAPLGGRCSRPLRWAEVGPITCASCSSGCRWRGAPVPGAGPSRGAPASRRATTSPEDVRAVSRGHAPCAGPCAPGEARGDGAACRPASRTRSATRWPPLRKANALMLEDPRTVPAAPLARIVEDNVQRLEAHRRRCAGGDAHRRRQSAAGGRRRLAGTVVQEGTTGQDGPCPGSGGRAAPAAQFDAEHLRRVLCEPADNACPPPMPRVRCASMQCTSRPRAGDHRRQRRTADRAGCRAPPVRAVLLDPQPRNGLGLYICRAELCERRPPSSSGQAGRMSGPQTSSVAMRGRPPDRGSHPSPTMPDTAAFSLLVVDDEPDSAHALRTDLLREGYDVETAGTVEEAWRACVPGAMTPVITDMRLPDGNGLSCFGVSTRPAGREKTLVITAYGSAENAVEALKSGAFDYLTKPVDLRQFRRVVASALGPAADGHRARDGHRRRRGAGPHGAWAGIRRCGVSSATRTGMRQVRSPIDRVARGMAPVMVLGRSGTGKGNSSPAPSTKSAARGLAGLRRGGCSAIPEQLLEAEFFGYRKRRLHRRRRRPRRLLPGGARRHAVPRRDRRPAAADAEQAAARDPGEEASVRPVGAGPRRLVNARIVSATHKDLAAEVQAGNFRQDLFYRLNVIEIQRAAAARATRRPAGHLPLGARTASPAMPKCRRAQVVDRCRGATRPIWLSRAMCVNSRTCCTGPAAGGRGGSDLPTWG